VRTIGLGRNENYRRLYQIVLLFFGLSSMTSPQAGGQPAAPLQGPDFVLSKVVSWKERPGADSELVLADGSAWSLKTGTNVYETQRGVISLAVNNDGQLFLSGDKARGTVEILLNARQLAAEEIGAKEVNGRYAVGFQGPPAVYYLRTDRPWFREALLLLRNSASSDASFSSPDLMVAIDPRNSEIVAVKPISSGKPGTSR
jgi:hypothetical protein